MHCFSFPGQKAGKHERDGEGEGSPSPKRSPKHSSKRGSKISKSPSRESTPGADSPVDQGAGHTSNDVVGDDNIEKENIDQPSAKSPTKSSPKKSKMGHKSSKSPSKVKSHKKEHKEGVEEPMTIDHQGTVESQVSSQEQTPKKMEQRDLEPLTPLIINDVSVTNHIPQATSTPAANGVISTGMQPASPPLSKCLFSLLITNGFEILQNMCRLFLVYLFLSRLTLLGRKIGTCFMF